MDLLLLLCLFSWMNQIRPVQAGHTAWEYTHQNGDIDRRWLGIGYGDDKDKYRRWPNHEVKYCYADDATEAKLKGFFEDAMELWYSANLPRSFKMTKVSKSEMENNRYTTLKITYNDRHSIYSTNIIPPEKFSQRQDSPIMSISIDEEHPAWTTTQIAHELGHTWGLVHEHQNRKFWTADYGGTGPSNAFQFHCENLIGFDKLREQLTEEQIFSRNGPCRNWITAAKIGFMSRAFLPRLDPMRYPSAYYSEDPDEMVDWDSIMLYESRTHLNPALRGPGVNVITRAKDNSRIFPDGSPSTQDVLGLLEYYDYIPTKLELQLLNNGAHPLHARFQEILCQN